jgi:small subunit ribosomal protein S3
LAVEKKFVQDGFVKALIDEYLLQELARAGYGGMMMNRTPMGTQITVFAEKPGMVIGKGGKQIRKLTRDLDKTFHLDNPQIDVQDIGKPELNAQVMANRLASSLERGWYFRKAGQSTIRRIMESGALGCEIILSGKLTGPRSRTEKIIRGYIKHSGKPAQELVDHGYAVAVKKLGTIGCQVRIVPPGVIPPDKFEILQVEAEEEVPEEAKGELEELLESEVVESEATEPLAVADEFLESESITEEAEAAEPTAETSKDEVVEEESIGQESAEAEEVLESEPGIEEAAEPTAETSKDEVVEEESIDQESVEAEEVLESEPVIEEAEEPTAETSAEEVVEEESVGQEPVEAEEVSESEPDIEVAEEPTAETSAEEVVEEEAPSEKDEKSSSG